MNKNIGQYSARKKGLKRFFLDLGNNHFDRVIDNLIINLESKMVELEIQNIEALKRNNYMTGFQIDFLKKELYAISEMKINYAYKHFEFHLKFLIKSYYPETKESQLFKWNFVEEALKIKKNNTEQN